MGILVNRTVVALLLLMLLTLSGCKKISYDIAKSEKPVDAPSYTVELNQNLSPAEDGVRKP